MRTIRAQFEEILKTKKDSVALINRKEYLRETWTYLQLYEYAQRITGLFEQNGIIKGDKIIIYSYNSPDWGAVLLGCSFSGVIAVPIDFNSSTEFVKRIHGLVDAKMVFCSSRKMVDGGMLMEHLFEDVTRFRSSNCQTKIEEDDILEIVYTSGTTSDPKGVVLTNENIVANINSLKEVMDLSNMTFLSMVPMSHMLEQTCGFFVPLFYGSNVVYTHSRRSSVLMAAIREENVTSAATVPAFLTTLKTKIEGAVEKQGKLDDLHAGLKKVGKMPLAIRRFLFRKLRAKIGSGLRFFFIGGAPLDAGVEAFWNTVGMRVFQGFGLTETAPIMTCGTFANNKANTVGQVLPNQEIKILDGEILCRGDNVFQGYYENKKATDAVFKDGWFYTGDIGEFDSSGYLTIKGRKKNMILSSSGMNVYPEDIERVLNELDGVKDSCVLGVKEGTDVIVTAVVLKDGDVNEKEVQEAANSHLNSHQHLQRVVFWDGEDFPRTPTLKVQRRFVLQGLKPSAKIESNVNDGALYKIIRKLSKSGVIKPEAVLSSDLAIDSLGRVELVSLLEEEFNVELDEDRVKENTTVGDIEKLVDGGVIAQRRGIHTLNTSSFARVVRYIWQPLFLSAFRLVYSVEAVGTDNCGGQVIYAVNHESNFDSISVLRAMPDRSMTACAVAEDYWFDFKEIKNEWLKPILRFLMRMSLNAYPFPRFGGTRRALQLTGKMISSGHSIIIYPEGTRTRTGPMGKFKTGIGLLALNMNVPIVPVRLHGMYRILPHGSRFPLFGHCKVVFGTPYLPSRDATPAEIAAVIEEKVRTL